MSEQQLISAHLRSLRISARKVRLVADLIRGMKADKALAELRVSLRGASAPMDKLLRSALANAKDRFELESSDLVIHTVRVNEGPTMKRFRARAFGRAGAIRKRTSHIELVLASTATASSAPKKAAKAKKTTTTTKKSSSAGKKNVATPSSEKKTEKAKPITTKK